MFLSSQCLREDICHILLCRYPGVIDYATFMEISAAMVANIYTFRSRLDDSTGDISRRAFIIAENGEWLGFFVVFVVFVMFVVSIVFDIFA